MSDADRLMSMESESRDLSNRVTMLESTVYGNNGVPGFVARLQELWDSFWRWHDETWIEFISKERRESCFYIKEKREMHNKKRFSMAKFAFITKEVAQAVGTTVILLKLFGIIP